MDLKNRDRKKDIKNNLKGLKPPARKDIEKLWLLPAEHCPPVLENRMIPISLIKSKRS